MRKQGLGIFEEEMTSQNISERLNLLREQVIKESMNLQGEYTDKETARKIMMGYKKQGYNTAVILKERIHTVYIHKNGG